MNRKSWADIRNYGFVGSLLFSDDIEEGFLDCVKDVEHDMFEAQEEIGYISCELMKRATKDYYDEIGRRQRPIAG